MIRRINKEELPMCLDFIHLCFSTVAQKFGLTRENCPGHNTFMPMEKLENFWNMGFMMYGFFEQNQNGENELAGYFSISKVPEKEDTWMLHNLCVRPQLRKQGYGRQLLDCAKEKTREQGGKTLFLDFIDEYTELKEWYFKNGFEFKGTTKYEHLPFTVGFAECDVTK
nr:GNAT family N-acetyltransferase [uncultured Treponema sp.]